MRKRSCFYCKGPNNTALCCITCGLQTIESKEQKSNVIISYLITRKRDSDDKEVPLLCNEGKVSKLNMPETTERVLDFLRLVRKCLTYERDQTDRLELKRTKEEMITIVTFKTKIRNHIFSTKVKFEIKTLESRIIIVEAYVVDQLTNELRMIKTNYKNLPVMVKQEQLDNRDECWKKHDILIGANYFLDLIQFDSII
ncbi:unnamed protein product [Onchocerca flexuosa]|uniref:DUF1758 domain-containing protein n=1 Tax=Onchocerca flexuosa TaxID=387005 RepID=A0A183I362_9BILA|nr:unnamed protein product [Onchocerca flexuosa]